MKAHRIGGRLGRHTYRKMARALQRHAPNPRDDQGITLSVDTDEERRIMREAVLAEVAQETGEPDRYTAPATELRRWLRHRGGMG